MLHVQKRDAERLMWNLMGRELGKGTGKQCDHTGGDDTACGAGEVCVGRKQNLPFPEGAGECHVADVTYVPAYPRRLSFDAEVGAHGGVLDGCAVDISRHRTAVESSLNLCRGRSSASHVTEMPVLQAAELGSSCRSGGPH